MEAYRPWLTNYEQATLREGKALGGWPLARMWQINRDGHWTIKRGRDQTSRRKALSR